ncbi:MAG: heavy-metal-associated domain-containing protein [Treponema sp.]|nr:heavy-metal-associated domain-containing protein [Treponema sp.]
MERKTFKVEGMSCGHCAGAVKQALGGVAGVADVAVNLKEGTVSCAVDPALATAEAVKAAIAGTGFEVAEVLNG